MIGRGATVTGKGSLCFEVIDLKCRQYIGARGELSMLMGM